MAKKLQRIDIAYSIVRHLSSPRSQDFLSQLAAAVRFDGNDDTVPGDAVIMDSSAGSSDEEAGKCTHVDVSSDCEFDIVHVYAADWGPSALHSDAASPKCSGDWRAIPEDSWHVVHRRFAGAPLAAPTGCSSSVASASRKRVSFCLDPTPTLHLHADGSVASSASASPPLPPGAPGSHTIRDIVQRAIDQRCAPILLQVSEVRERVARLPRRDQLQMDDVLTGVEADCATACRAVRDEVCTALNLDATMKEFASVHIHGKLNGINKRGMVQTASKAKKKKAG